MARSKTVLLSLVFGLLALSAANVLAEVDDDSDVADAVEKDDEYADVERALLVLRKYVKEESAIQGRNVTVYLDVFNAGSGTASKVHLKDSLPAHAKLVGGELTASFARVPVGSHVEHSYVIQFTSGNVAAGLPQATVSYTPEAESAEVQKGLSSTPQFFVLTPVQQISRLALNAGAYASLGFLRSAADWRNLSIFLTVVGSLLGGNWAVKSFSSHSVDRKRAAALKSFEK